MSAPRRRSRRSTGAAARPSRRRPGDPRRPGARPARGHRRASATSSSATGEIAELAEAGRGRGRRRRGDRRRRACALFPAFFDPHVHLRTPGPRGRGGRRDRHRAPPPPAASAGSSRWRTPTRRSTPPPTSPPCASGRASRPRCPTGFVATRDPGHAGRGADRDGASSPRPAPSASPTTGCRSAAPGCCAARFSTSASSALPIALHEEDPELSAGGVDARGRGLGGARDRRRARRSRSRR